MNEIKQSFRTLVRPWARAVGLLALMTGCANHDRDNSFDPVNTPTFK